MSRSGSFEAEFLGAWSAPPRPAHAPIANEERLRCVIELSSDYYWEQDEHHRFTLMLNGDSDEDCSDYLGKTSWEVGSTPVDGDWEGHKAVRSALRPFVDFVVRRKDKSGADRYLSITGQPVFDAGGSFCGYRGITRDVTQQIRERRLLELDRTVTRILSTSGDTTEVLTAAMRAICESEGWEAGHYWTLDEHDHVMRVHVAWSIDAEAIRRVTASALQLALAPSVGLVGEVWDNGDPLWIPDVKSHPRLLRKDLPEITGWNSALLFPVLTKGRIIGVLDFNARYIPEPDERLLQVIRVLSTQIGNFYERAVALERLRESEERYSSTVELAAIGIAHVSADGRFIEVNRQICNMLGYTKEELLQLTVKDVSHPNDVDVTDTLRARLRSGEITSFRAEKRYLRKDGTTVWVRLTVASKRGQSGATLYDISVVEDISERKRAEERVQYLATHDEMTDLPNRATFGQLLEHAIESGRRAGGKVAVLFIDLDRFKIINDSLGHHAGDELLRQTARRLKRCLRGSDVLARLGGDEFVVLIEDVRNKRQVANVARKIIAATMKPVALMGQECRVTASVGISMYPEDGADALGLMRTADVAMYNAKEQGKNNFQFFSRETESLSIEQLTLEGNLRRALDRNELYVHYQPQVELSTGRIKGAEALLRWWNHHLGTVPPARFIPLAEDIGLIVPIGKWVLETACKQNVAWQRQGLPPISMCVNISPRQFRDEHFVADVLDVLERTGAAPGSLELEITEGLIMHDVEQSMDKLAALKKAGVRLAIDDFGTGYSSLAQLKRFPIDDLKIDRSFISEIPRDAEDKAITEAIIAMAKRLGVGVIAEGVETAEQRNFLHQRGCDQMQGYYFSKACSANAFAALLHANSGPFSRVGTASAAILPSSTPLKRKNRG